MISVQIMIIIVSITEGFLKKKQKPVFTSKLTNMFLLTVTAFTVIAFVFLSILVFIDLFVLAILFVFLLVFVFVFACLVHTGVCLTRHM